MLECTEVRFCVYAHAHYFDQRNTLMSARDGSEFECGYDGFVFVCLENWQQRESSSSTGFPYPHIRFL